MIQEAGVVMDRLATIADVLGDRFPLASCFWHAVSGLRAGFAKEDPASGRVHGEAAMAIAEAVGHRRYRDIAHIIAHLNVWLLGAPEEAERAVKESTLPDEEMGYVSSLRPFILAWMLAERGALDEAQERAARLIASGQARRLPIDEGRGHWALAEVLRRAGDFDAADREIQAALGMLAMACPLDVPGALATLAALRLEQGKPAEALAAAEQGLARYESMGACSYFFRGAFLRLVHAESLDATGQKDAARAAIAKARQCILINAEKIKAPAYRKSFLENVPENRRTFELAEQWLGEVVVKLIFPEDGTTIEGATFE
jgi:tetratricopeptide (TPR) repeat protein